MVSLGFIRFIGLYWALIGFTWFYLVWVRSGFNSLVFPSFTVFCLLFYH